MTEESIEDNKSWVIRTWEAVKDFGEAVKSKTGEYRSNFDGKLGQYNEKTAAVVESGAVIGLGAAGTTLLLRKPEEETGLRKVLRIGGAIACYAAAAGCAYDAYNRFAGNYTS